MGKKSSTAVQTAEAVGDDIETMSREMDELEYQMLLKDQELAEAKGRYWNLSILIERTVLTEMKRAEVEEEMEGLQKRIEEMDTMLSDHRTRLTNNRARLERVRDELAARRTARKR